MKGFIVIAMLVFSGLTSSPALAFLDGLLGAAAAPEAPAVGAPLGDVADKSGPFTTFAEVGMSGFKTLWIPGRYTGTRRPQLYIQGQKYAAPGGSDQVLGFLPAPYGYFVAVHQPAGPITVLAASNTPATALTPAQLAKMTPAQQISALQLQLQIMQLQSAQGTAQLVGAPAAGRTGQWHVVYYRVSRTGETLGVIADVPAGAQTWVTPDAIFVAQPGGKRSAGDAGSRSVFNVVGYTPSGARMEGPQDALYAAPGPAGEWYWYSLNGDSSETLYKTINKAGKVRVLGRGWAGDRVDALRSSQQAFVDLPPIADSVRTGHVLYTAWHNGRGGIQGLSSGSLYLVPLAASHAGSNPKALTLIGHHREHDALVSVAERAGLFGTPDRPLYAGQAARPAYKEPGVNLYTLNPVDPDQDYYALYNVMGTGAHVLRSLFGDNSGGSFSMAALNDLFVVITPKTTIGINATPGGANVRAFDLINRKALTGDELYSFVVKYGFALN
jgi:hypothetical protein